MDYHRQYNINIKIARLFNTYGDGTQPRSFSYIDDTINGLIKLMNSEFIQPMNIGNPNEITIKTLADTLNKIMNSDTSITYKELPLDDPTNRKPDINLAIKELKWEPVVDLTMGLIKTIEYFQNL